MYVLACIALLIYFIKIDSYVINVEDISLTDAYPTTPPDSDPVTQRIYTCVKFPFITSNYLEKIKYIYYYI